MNLLCRLKQELVDYVDVKGELMDYTNFTIIIPTINEKENISALLDTLPAVYPGVRIIVSDDGSTDGTKQIATEKSKSHPNIFFLDREPLFFTKEKTFGRKESINVHGLTASVLDAIEQVETDFFIVMDADFQHPIEKIAEICTKLNEGNDIVVACRSKVENWGFHRQAISAGATLLGKLRLRLTGAPQCNDIMSGFFGMRTALAKQIIAKNKNRFVGEGYKVLFELLKFFPTEQKTKIKIAEVPYTFGSRTTGNSKIGIGHILCFLKALA